MTTQEALKVFPEIKQVLKDSITRLQGMLVIYESKEQRIKQEMAGAMPNEHWAYEMMLELNQSTVDELIKELKSKTWKLNELTGKSVVSTGQITDDDILQAKRIPLEGFFSKGKKLRNKLWVVCPFHKSGMEKNPSLCIYLGQNSWWCYTCSEGGTVVDYIMKSQNLKFLDAIKYLLQK